MSIESKIRARLTDYIRSRFEMISVVPTQGLFNFRCYQNAVEFARKSEVELEVIEVVYIDNEIPILHYVNLDPKTGQYMETTLGFEANDLEYYLIKKIHPSDHKHIGTEFNRSLNSWRDQWVPWYKKPFVKRIL